MRNMDADRLNSVWYLEHQLFEQFPEELAEDWDNVGLLVGDPTVNLSGIAIALDPSAARVEASAQHGCNVLLTHHPVFLEPPRRILSHLYEGPVPRSASVDAVDRIEAGITVSTAIRHGINLIAMHTNLDRSPYGLHLLPDALGLSLINSLDHMAVDDGLNTINKIPSYLQTSSLPSTSLLDLASRCKDVFGRAPRIWGDSSKTVELVDTCPGSVGSLLADALRLGLDCVICGEVRYHAARAAKELGIAIIELGHDVSEMLYTEVFRIVLGKIGFPADDIVLLDEKDEWWTV